MSDAIVSFLAEWSAAEQAGDTAKLGPLLTDDFVGIGPLGFALTKAAWLARHHQGLSYDGFSVDDAQVRIYGDVALVTARYAQTGTAFDHPLPEAARATNVLVRDGDRWQLASVHMSFVAGTTGAPPLPGPTVPSQPGERTSLGQGGNDDG
jgi:ketosteroid isomerase-like protein